MDNLNSFMLCQVYLLFSSSTSELSSTHLSSWGYVDPIPDPIH